MNMLEFFSKKNIAKRLGGCPKKISSYSTGPNIFKQKFTGQEKDENTGLQYHSARYYDAEIGRFISADSIIDGVTKTAGFNRYMYCHGNPIRYMDPSGMDGDHSFATQQAAREQQTRDKIKNNITNKRAAAAKAAAQQAAMNRGGNGVNGASGVKKEKQGFLSKTADFFIGAGKFLVYSFSAATMGHISQERLDEILPRPELENDAQVTGAVVAWFAEPLIAYYSLKKGFSKRSRKSYNNANSRENRLLLRRQLSYEEASSVFDRFGKIKQSIINESKVIIKGEKLNNRNLRDILTSDGSLITDWAKMSTQTIKSPHGVFQVHFYMNLRTMKVFYGMDYKVKFNSGIK